jgi:PIN domain nuclease of toxin-antitoxin system
MKAYLLDTHILLWWLFNDKKLTKDVKELIEDVDNDIVVSAVSIWEIVIKKSANKLEVPDNLQEILHENEIRLLSMKAEHAFYLEQLPKLHSDPFDRLLIAQCVVENLVFVTADKIIPHYKIKCF